MRKFSPLLLLVLAVQLAWGQAAEVTSLRFNPALYYRTQKNPRASNQLKYLIAQGNIVVQTGKPISIDTFPFIDDFSTDKTPYYLALKDSLYDTLYNVVGACLGPEGVTTIEGYFDTVPTYRYYWDTAHKELDSTPIAPMILSFMNPGSSQCIAKDVYYSKAYWPIGYVYTFDSASGIVLDSFQNPNASNYLAIEYAPVLYFAVGDTIGTLWFDSYAYINDNFPINPPTIGVATLDGLDQYGQPYNSTTGTGGQADYLTSNQIDLSNLSVNDSVYLSFYFEPGGNGDYPGVGDSLVVEILDQAGIWQQLWVDTGYVDSVPDTFQQVLLQIPQEDAIATFFHAGFQFRFRNVVTLYGLNNMWHIDYVRLGKQRNAGDTIINDLAFQYPYPSVLKNYTLEPGPQINFPADFADTLFLPVRNLEQAVPATNYLDSSVELYPLSQLVAAPQLQTFNANPYDTLQVYPSAQFSNYPSAPLDSFVLWSQIYMHTLDALPANDTIRQTQIFSNIMAYDDGSAEKAFGLTGGDDVKKFAYEFDLNYPDTLVGFQIMFTQAEANVSDLVFDFDVWDSIQLNNYTWMDTPVYTFVNQLPYYIDSMNGYTTYLFDSSIHITGKKVYIGWDQTDSRRLQVGYDVNDTFGHPHMFTYFEGKWDSAYVQPAGSPMIRAIFRHYYGISSDLASIKNIPGGDNTLDLYPNPTSGLVYFHASRAAASYAVDVYNSMGQLAASEPVVTNQLDLGKLTDGVYLLNARDLQTGEVFHKRIIKTAPR